MDKVMADSISSTVTSYTWGLLYTLEPFTIGKLVQFIFFGSTPLPMNYPGIIGLSHRDLPIL